MKIWIVSSDPFLKDFEKISSYWPAKDEVYITTLTKYNVGLMDFFRFFFLYLKIKPNSILTDHGYFGFWLVRTYNLVFTKKVPIVFFLRGNYWLEERKRAAL